MSAALVATTAVGQPPNRVDRLDQEERVFYDEVMRPLLFSTQLGRLYQGDCLEILPEMDDASVDLVFADPPFNLGKDYGKSVNDSLADAEYLGWCGRWITECVRVLKPGGAFYLFNLPRWNIELGHRLNMEGMLFRHWIAVDIKYSLPIPGRLYPSHYSLLYYTKGKPKFFNRPRVPIPVCRHCGGDLKDYGGHRDKLNPEGLNLTDVWTDIPPVRHKSTKRRSANELSIKLLRRVLEISSQPGDVVLDPFGGSGTTYAAAEEMHRHWVGIELGDCEPIVRRLRGESANVLPKNLGDAAKGMTRYRRQRALGVGQLSLLEQADESLYHADSSS
ncbi:MAG: site-specific DNA-methyltransferase [Chloroflexi bacterium]|nr:site-specific DNA-methyltransferase [Chloroflexota bacterium]